MPKTKKRELTARQQEVFDTPTCIDARYPPTNREIGSEFGFSEKAAHDHLNAIEKKGYIQRVPNVPRSIIITDASVSETLDKICPKELLLEITPEMDIKAKGFHVDEYIRIQRQPFGVAGDIVVSTNVHGILTLRQLTGPVRGIWGAVM